MIHYFFMEFIMEFATDTWWLFGIIVSAAIAIIGFFLKRTINQTDEHDKSINEIKRTYVTKDEMKDTKADFYKTVEKIQTDVEKMQSQLEQCLKKPDFYASINELKEENRDQNKTITELIKEMSRNGN